MKLTTAQKELLGWMASRPSLQVTRNHSSAKVLARLGLIEIEEVPPPYGWKVRLTDAGRAALKDQETSHGS